MPVSKKDVIIIGGGAAGLMCAAEAGKRGRSVLVIEHADKIGKKILISGGGRCNFTNKFVSSENFISGNPHFCKSALSQYTPDDFISLIEKHKISYHEKKLGQLFCDGSSRQVVELLENECRQANAEIMVDCRVRNISVNESFVIETSGGKFMSGSLVISSGGISIPKMGATDFGYKIAEQFGLKLTEIRPGLVPLTLNENERKIFGQLSGISIDCIVKFKQASFRENMLFTHKGLSGPAILQISSFLKEGQSISIDLLPDENLSDRLTENSSGKSDLINFVSNYLPKRFAEVFCSSYFVSKPLNQYSQKDLKNIAAKFHNWIIRTFRYGGF